MKTAMRSFTSGLLIFTMVMASCAKEGDSSPMEVALQNEPPLSFGLIDVADGATGVSVLPTLSLKSTKNPKGSEVTFDLYLGKDTNSTTVYKRDILATSNQITELPNLLNDDDWKVIAIDVDGMTSQSAIHKFTTRNLTISTDPLVDDGGQLNSIIIPK